MSTTLYFRNTQWDGVTGRYDLLSTQGSANDTAVVDSGTGLPVQFTKTAGGQQIVFWSGGLTSPVALTGDITFHLYAMESNNKANCGIQVALYSWDITSVSEADLASHGTFVYGGSPPTEIGTSAGDRTITVSGYGTINLAQGARLVAIVSICQAGGTMTPGYTCTWQFNNTGNYNSSLQLTENVTFVPVVRMGGDLGFASGQLITVGDLSLELKVP